MNKNKKSILDINLIFNIISVLIIGLSLLMLVLTSNLLYVLLLVFSISMFVIVNIINVPNKRTEQNKSIEIISKRQQEQRKLQPKKSIEDVRKILAEREFKDFENLKQISETEFEYKPEIHVDVNEKVKEDKTNVRNLLKNKLNHLIEQSEKEMNKTFGKKKAVEKKTTKKKITKIKKKPIKKKAVKKKSVTKKKKPTKKSIKKKAVKKKSVTKKKKPTKKSIKKTTKKKKPTKKSIKKKAVKKKSVTKKKKPTKKKPIKKKKTRK